jgi:uncharacterized Zn-binding protein involved in type VI secretion
MGAPAIVMGDRVTGTCPLHQIPNPAAAGAPTPGPPMPFSAPLTMGLVATVLIGGKQAAVVGASGLNTPPHVGLHASDPFMAPSAQIGRVVSGSPTVLIGGQPAATAQSQAMLCASPGTIVPTVATVLIG